jgi:hypothetical protein
MIPTRCAGQLAEIADALDPQPDAEATHDAAD